MRQAYHTASKCWLRDISAQHCQASYCTLLCATEWMKWHPGSNVLLVAVKAGEVYMWKVPSGECKVHASHGVETNCGTFMPDGRRAAIGYDNGIIRILDLKTMAVLHEVSTGLSGAIRSISCHDNNSLLAACCGEFVTMVNAQTGQINNGASISRMTRNCQAGFMLPDIVEQLGAVQSGAPPDPSVKLPSSLCRSDTHQGEPGSIPCWVTPGFSQVGILLKDAAGRQVFLGISCFPHLCILALLYSHLISHSLALKTSLRAVQICHLSSTSAYFFQSSGTGGTKLQHASRGDKMVISSLGPQGIVPNSEVNCDVETALEVVEFNHDPSLQLAITADLQGNIIGWDVSKQALRGGGAVRILIIDHNSSLKRQGIALWYSQHSFSWCDVTASSRQMWANACTSVFVFPTCIGTVTWCDMRDWLATSSYVSLRGEVFTNSNEHGDLALVLSVSQCTLSFLPSQSVKRGNSHLPRAQDVGTLQQVAWRGNSPAASPSPPAPGGHSGVVIRLLPSHFGELGSISGEVIPRFLHVGIVPDNAAGRRVFSGTSRFFCPFISTLLHTCLASPSAFKTSVLRATQIPLLPAATRYRVEQNSGTVKIICLKNNPVFFTASLQGCIHMYSSLNGEALDELMGHRDSILDFVCSVLMRVLIPSEVDWVTLLQCNNVWVVFCLAGRGSAHVRKPGRKLTLRRIGK
ncbi:hypothetical protein PR048_031575 [Dryococelus australis]|uniref:Uncharacterized protein n=1 Tax=Dryococelus australis TaxID=614101 RepID=A0ABQ9G5N2_9NEOP|nr:hypothetical protein PR048_031575 [Dryococelus australis]